jgi:hypothetical protein
MQLVTVATFDQELPAQVLKERLEHSGVPAHVLDERTLQYFWFFSRPAAGMRLKVHTDDYERALSLLHGWDASEGVLREAVRCPECGSSRVEFPQFSRNSVLPTLFCHLCAAVGIMKHEFYCRDCQNTWTRPASEHEARNAA